MSSNPKPIIRVFETTPTIASFAHQLRERGFKITYDLDQISNNDGAVIELCHFDVGTSQQSVSVEFDPRVPQIAIVPFARKSADLEVAALRQGYSDVFYAFASARVLEARLLAIRRRMEVVARQSKEVLPDFYIWDRYVPLSPSQLRVLMCLYRRKGCPVSRETLALHADQLSEMSLESSVNCIIKRIRKKLAEAGAVKDLISSRYGFGYKLDEDCEMLGLVCRKPTTDKGCLDARYRSQCAP